MITKEAIEALQQSQAITAANAVPAYGGTPIMLPSDFTEHDLEKYMPDRRRARGNMQTTSISDFADYTNEHAETGCTAFVNAQKFTATAVLNLGTPAKPGHADNTATLTPEKTAAYAALTGITGRGITQQAAAEFLEDWIDHIECYVDTGSESATVQNRKAIGAIRRITIEALRKVESEVQSLSATQSAFESIAASSKDAIPTLIYFNCQPYAELAERLFVLRLGIVTGDKAPHIVLRIIKEEQHREEMAAELCQILAGKVEAGTIIGSYQRGN